MTRHGEALVVSLALTAVAGVLAAGALRLSGSGAIAPIAVAVPTLVMLVDQSRRLFGTRVSSGADVPGGTDARAERRVVAWMAGLVVLMWGVGVPSGAALFLAAYLRAESRVALRTAVAAAAVLWAALTFGAGIGLGVVWRPGVWGSWGGA
jgi:hypothetical protein